MTNPQPKTTPATDSRESIIFGIYDHLLNHGHCVPNVVLAPAKVDGTPDWENAGPANLEDLPADEWPNDPITERRAAVIIDHVAGCSEQSSFLYYFDSTERLHLTQIAGPDADKVIAENIVARDMDLPLAERPASPMMPELADIAERFEKKHEQENPERYGKPPAAANDNHPLERYLAAFSGPKSVLMNDIIYDAVIEGVTGKIKLVGGKVMFVTRHFTKAIELPVASGPRLVSSGDFVRGFQPPDYAIEGVAQKGFVYSLTASTGTGKTAIALLLALLTERGEDLAGREVAKGRVVYFAGENPDDIAMRWIGICHERGLDPAKLDVHFITERFSIPKAIEAIRSQVDAVGGAGLVVVDTSAAYFQGDDENGNTALGGHARDLRALTTLPGKPCVIVPCHPTKNAQADALLPRGGGAFIAEMDGNLTLSKAGEVIRLHWQGKHRGPDFKPICFRLQTVSAPQLLDSKGRPVPTVMAVPTAEGENGGVVQRLLDGPNRKALAALHELYVEGEPVTMASWRAKCREVFDDGAGKSRGALDQKFNRAKTALLEQGRVEEVEKGFVPIKQAP